MEVRNSKRWAPRGRNRWLVAAAALIAAATIRTMLHPLLGPVMPAVSFLIAVPTVVHFVTWIGTMWKGSLEFTTAMLFSIGFLFNFLLGGITGVMVAAPPIE